MASSDQNEQEPSGPNDAGPIRDRFTKAALGDASAIAMLLESFRPLLLKQANQSIADDLRPKAAPSDVVQSTLVAATVGFTAASFRTADDVLAWLRKILEREVTAVNRRFRNTKKRELARERPLDARDSRDGLRELSASLSATASNQLERHEQIQHLAACMLRLPRHYREIIRWRHFDELSFAHIGKTLERQPDDVRMLFRRALKRLKKEILDVQSPENNGDARST